MTDTPTQIPGTLGEFLTTLTTAGPESFTLTEWQQRLVDHIDGVASLSREQLAYNARRAERQHSRVLVCAHALVEGERVTMVTTRDTADSGRAVVKAAMEYVESYCRCIGVPRPTFDLTDEGLTVRVRVDHPLLTRCGGRRRRRPAA